MIQMTLTTDDDPDPGSPMDVPPVSSGERAPFLRDRTLGETEDLIRDMVRRGIWVPGEYKVYHDGHLMGTVNAPGTAKFGLEDYVCPADMFEDRGVHLKDGSGSTYYPNKGRVLTRLYTPTGWIYSVEFPGAEGVGKEIIPMPESQLRSWSA